LVSTRKVLDLENIATTDGLANQISNKFQEWDTFRNTWLAEKQELRQFLFATDTRKTSNSKLPWKNSTTLPKLCQIRDNLHANYLAALVPNSDFFIWEGDSRDSVHKDKQDVIEAFVSNKVRASEFVTTLSDLLLDWIDYGNCFAMTTFVDERRLDKKTGEMIPGYVGPKTVRISPTDIAFDPTALAFTNTPKIIRTLKSLGELMKAVNLDPLNKINKDALNKALETRTAVRGLTLGDQLKDAVYAISGFSSYQNYLQSDTVELLTFYGDLYDMDTNTLYENHEIVIMDRRFVISKAPVESWLGEAPIRHCGWRIRPDNLYAMGPLDNLVGMQYRIDHLENLKADAFDMIAFPMHKIVGEVQAYTYQPGEKIYVGDGGDVQSMHPDKKRFGKWSLIQ
jgi:hypothetical protein